jgi:ribosome maturation factor RimP
MGQAEEVRALVEPVLANEGLELFDLEVKPGLLRITVDKAGGVDIDRLGQLSKRLSRLLDERDPIPNRYTMEVTSPGLERSLRTREHFRKAVGSQITVRTTVEAAEEGDRRTQGTLEAADDSGIVVSVHGAPPGATSRRITYDQIDRARTVFEWGGKPKPGSRKNEKKRAAS